MNALNRFTDPVYCVMRLIAGLLLAQHGGQLVLGMFGGMPGSDKMITQVGGWIQLIGGFMIAFGLFTRLAAFICMPISPCTSRALRLGWLSFSRSPVPGKNFRITANLPCFIAGFSFLWCFTGPDDGASTH